MIMNRYRTIPGQGPPKATSVTTCQKCLKKDNYECKAGATERPYISRPSRTQQLLNPKLKPRLTFDAPNELLRKDGIADEQLAQAQKARDVASDKARRSSSPSAKLLRRARSVSVSSSDSVSTISTNRSRSRSRSRIQQESRQSQEAPKSEYVRAKRKHGDMSSSRSRSPPRLDQDAPQKSRRFGSASPRDRGRQTTHRRGSHRDRSQSSSHDRSEVTKHRTSMNVSRDDRVGHSTDPQSDRSRSNQAKNSRPSVRRERSLSPFSKRLALTQSMNMAQ